MRSPLTRLQPRNLYQSGAKLLPGCPLMHGTGQFTTLLNLCQGGATVLLVNRHFDVEELLDTIERERVGVAVIVGDAFAKPMVRALDAQPDRWDLSSLFMMASSGVMWSHDVKEALLRHNRPMKPIIAAVEGYAVAGGTEILQGTDIRVAAEDAIFGVTEARRGLFPLGGSSVRLRRQIPYTLAAEILSLKHEDIRRAYDEYRASLASG